jgi:hypothetical protein
MPSHRSHIAALALPLTLAFAGIAFGQVLKDAERTTERELKVSLSSAIGDLRICKGDGSKLFSLEGRGTDAGQYDANYTVQNRVGYMDLKLGSSDEGDEGKKSGIHINGFKSRSWLLHMSNAVPISFDIEMGVGRGDLNLSGLPVKDLNITSGASDVTLAFDEPNASTIENLTIESGVSKFNARNLGNANFRRLHFQGGVGTFMLDFSGAMKNEADVDLEVGLGLATIIVPWDVGARVEYQKGWMARIDCSNDFRSTGEEQYTSENFDSARVRINIRIDSGVGAVRVRRP